jgi:predicted small lipoprotein YifL
VSKRVALFFLSMLAAAVLALSGCGDGGPTPSKAQTAAPSEPTQQDFGDFEVHYNALRTDQLAPEVARAYGIERSANRVMLNVSLLRKNPDGSTTPVDGTVTASAYNLNGQVKDLQMRRITEGTSFYFIGEVGISGAEILVFDIDAAPGGQTSKYSVQFKREFFAD